MSTKTTFKRVALVAAVAAAFGGLSTVAANATAYDSIGWIAGGTAHTNGGAGANSTASAITGTFVGETVTATTNDNYLNIVSTGVGTLQIGSTGASDTTSNGYAVNSATSITYYGGSAQGVHALYAGTLTFSATSAVAGTQTITVTGNTSSAITETITWGAAQTVSAAYSTAVLNSGATSWTLPTAATVAGSKSVLTQAGIVKVSVYGQDGLIFTNGNPTVAASISGSGLVSVDTSNTSEAGTARVASWPAASGIAYVHISSDGSSGVGTVTITATDPNTGTTVTVGTATVTFFGAAAAVKATANLKVLQASGTTNSAGTIPASGAANVAHLTPLTAIVTDANGVQTSLSGIYVKAVSSNTAILPNVTCVAAVTSAAVPASISTPAISTAATAGVGEYNCPVYGVALAASGSTATETVEVSTDSGVTWSILATPVTFAIGGAITKEVLSTDAATYSPLQAITVTVTATDAAGNAAYDQDVTSTTTAGVTTGTLVGSLTSSILLGGTLASPTQIVGGIGTATGAYAPASEVSGVKISGTDSTSAANAISATFDVANGAASTAANAATDAANEATDAANAATDAANAAADAADAATSAAQDASAKADAALAAVNALSAKITVLAAQIAKIVKKLGA